MVVIFEHIYPNDPNGKININYNNFHIHIQYFNSWEVPHMHRNIHLQDYRDFSYPCVILLKVFNLSRAHN